MNTIKRVFFSFLIIVTGLLLTSCSADPLIGRWECISPGNVDILGFDAGGIIEFTDDYILKEFAYNTLSYNYEKISDGKIKIDEYWDSYIITYERRGDELIFSDNRSSVTYKLIK